jgi:hypothetical protein
LYLWDKTIAKEDEDELSIVLLRFLDGITRMVEIAHDDRKRIIAPPKTQYCCSLCGVNHQAKDFLRAILLHLIDQLEENDKFVKFLHDSSIFLISLASIGSSSSLRSFGIFTFLLYVDGITLIS